MDFLLAYLDGRPEDKMMAVYYGTAHNDRKLAEMLKEVRNFLFTHTEEWRQNGRWEQCPGIYNRIDWARRVLDGTEPECPPGYGRENILRRVRMARRNGGK